MATEAMMGERGRWSGDARAASGRTRASGMEMRRSAARRSATKRAAVKRGLGFESLEERRVMAVLLVGSGGFSTVQAAVRNARPGDEISILSGAYHESVDLSLMGAAIGGSPGSLTIRGESTAAMLSSPSGPALYNSAAFNGNLTISDLTLESSVASNGEDSGGRFNQVRGNISISGVDIVNTKDDGLSFLNHTGNITLTNCFFDTIGDSLDDDGIVLSQVAGTVSVTDNVVLNARDRGLAVEASGSIATVVKAARLQVSGDSIDFRTTTSAVRVAAAGTSNVVLLITESDFSGTSAVGVDVVANNSARVETRMLISRISNGNAGGVHFDIQDSASGDLTLVANDLSSLSDSAIDVSASTSAKIHSRISDNVMNSAYGSASVSVSAADSSELRMDYSGNDLSQTGGDGMTVRSQGAAYLNLSVRNSRFNAIGGQALILSDSSDATGNLRANIHDNLFQTVGGNGVRVEPTGAADFYVRIADNSMSSVNSSTSSAAILVDGTSGLTGNNVDLIVTGNVIVPGAGNAIELRQAAPGTMRLEGGAANAAQQLADANPATPIATSGTITMVATGAIAPQIPLELSGMAWLDNDKNGIRATGDDAELPAQDVMFTLTGVETASGRNVTLQGRSDDQGVYVFAGLLPGTFTVTVIPPLGMVVSPSNQGTDDTLDSDFSTTTRTASVTLAALTSESTTDAGVRQTWQNSTNRRDVDNDTFVVPRDVLIIINTLNSEGARELPTPTPGGAGPPPYYDVNGDGFVAPNDALVIINFLNGATGAEGESADSLAPVAVADTRSAVSSDAATAIVDAVFAAESWNSRRRGSGRAGF